MASTTAISKYRRVRFDYTGALQLAADLVTVAEAAEAEHAGRAAIRDTAFDPSIFQGPYGDLHRGFAEAEDLKVVALGRICRLAADRWAQAWATAVDDYNDAAAEWARAQMRGYDFQRDQDFREQSQTVTGFVTPPFDGTVVAPAPAPVPVGPAYTPENAFAHYDFGRYTSVARPTYTNSP